MTHTHDQGNGWSGWLLSWEWERNFKLIWILWERQLLKKTNYMYNVSNFWQWMGNFIVPLQMHIYLLLCNAILWHKISSLKNIQAFFNYLFFSYFSARSLEPLTGVLDALSSAWQTWGDDDSLPGAPLGNQWQSDVRHRQSADKPFIFSQ